MRRLAMAMTAILVIAQGAGAEPAGGDAIRAAISDQVADFRAGDVAGAWEHASGTIRAIFGTPENFGRMVRSGYPMIWKPAGLRYLGLRAEGGRLFQRVMVTDGAGQSFLFDYEMTETPDGWRINGVFPVEGDVGA